MREGQLRRRFIPVSPDTVEAETGASDETGKVNQPRVTLMSTTTRWGGINDWVLRFWWLIVKPYVTYWENVPLSCNIFMLFVYFRPGVAVLYVVGLAMCTFESLPFTGFLMNHAFYKKRVSRMFGFLLSVWEGFKLSSRP